MIDIYTQTGESYDVTLALIRPAVEYNKRKGLNVSSPKSILNSALSIHAAGSNDTHDDFNQTLDDIFSELEQ